MERRYHDSENIDLGGEWAGWRIRGRRLIAPNGEWVTPEVLDRLMHGHWRLFGYAQRVSRRRDRRA